MSLPRFLVSTPEQFFDPTNLTRGIELADGPRPGLRHSAYSVSYDRRIQGNWSFAVAGFALFGGTRRESC